MFVTLLISLNTKLTIKQYLEELIQRQNSIKPTILKEVLVNGLASLVAPSHCPLLTLTQKIPKSKLKVAMSLILSMDRLPFSKSTLTIRMKQQQVLTLPVLMNPSSLSLRRKKKFCSYHCSLSKLQTSILVPLKRMLNSLIRVEIRIKSWLRLQRLL